MIRNSLAAALALLALSVAAPSAFAHDTGAHGASHDQADHADCDEITLGDLTISAPFTRATLPNAPVGGGFLTITNSGSADDRLVSATSAIAKETQIHEMAMDGDVMKMRQLADGLAIPAGETVALEPGGFHLMFMGLSAPIVEGETVSVTLTFEKAGEITLDLPAAGSAADAAAGHEGH